jgi:LysR family glycine cleavage system transcriptional activator
MPFEQLYFALQAAVASLGVALAPRPLVEDDLASGRLVVAVASRGAGDRAYAILHPRDTPKDAALRVVSEWLVAKGRDVAV